VSTRLEIRNEDSVVTNCIVSIQSKATDGTFEGETDSELTFTCSERDLRYWLKGNLPVIVVYSRPRTDVACWLSVKEYFSHPIRRAARKLRFAKARDSFNLSAKDALTKLALLNNGGLYLGATPKHETIFTDLLPVKQFPERFYHAHTHFSSRKEASLRVERAAALFTKEIEFLAENSNPSVIICALPLELLELLSEEKKSPGRKDLHHLLKARTMEFRIPIQLILPSTYDESKARKQKRAGTRRPLQDEATRAWNIFSALYNKAGGTPWRLVRDPAQLSACFVGISFFESLDRSRLTTSMAQVFNELGEGVVVRGGAASLSKDDRQPHLSGDDCRRIIANARERYRDVHFTLPARIVIHESSPFSTEEEAGAKKAVQEAKIAVHEFVHLTESDIRLYRDGIYPPLRGTFLQTSARSGVLYTKGSVPFFETYPGMYVPRPVSIKIAAGNKTPSAHAKEILAE
jgi:hypothetical protein